MPPHLINPVLWAEAFQHFLTGPLMQRQRNAKKCIANTFLGLPFSAAACSGFFSLWLRDTGCCSNQISCHDNAWRHCMPVLKPMTLVDEGNAAMWWYGRPVRLRYVISFHWHKRSICKPIYTLGVKLPHLTSGSRSAFVIQSLAA